MPLKKRNNSALFENPLIPSVLIACWACFASLWNLGMSLAMFGILFWAVLCFLNNPRLIQRISLNKAVVIPLLLWLTLLLIALLKGNVSNGLNELKTLVPFAFAPLFFLAFSHLRLSIIWTGFILGTFLSLSISSIYALMHYPLPDPRNASIFISHIRLCLFAAIALYLLLQLKYPYKYFFVSLYSLALFTFLVLSATLSGWFFLSVVLIIHLSFKRKKLILLSSLTILSIVGGSSVVLFKKIKANVSSGNTLNLTANGNKYDVVEPSHQTENNFFVFQNICEKEVKSAWEKRTGSSPDTKDARNQTIYNTAIRYLTSKNLTKDSVGVYALSNEDIQNIQLGFTNSNEPSRSPLDKRLHQLQYEIQVFLDNGNASGHSLFQRLHYYKAALAIIENSLPWGVGLGNVKQVYTSTYQLIHSNLDTEHQHAVHNQFLSYLISGGIIAFFLFLGYFVFFWKETATMGLFEAYVSRVFLALAFTSCLSEDTLTTQPGVAFFAVFSALLFTRKN